MGGKRSTAKVAVRNQLNNRRKWMFHRFCETFIFLLEKAFNVWYNFLNYKMRSIRFES